MKRVIVFMTFYIIIAIPAGCTVLQPMDTGDIITEAVSQAFESSTAQTQTQSPTETASSPSITNTPVITGGPIPGPLGNQWYDWDNVGAYPGASVAQCGNRIAFQTLKRVDEHTYESYLSFANPDGSNCVRTKIKDPSNLNYKDGWVYFVKNDSIYKVKTDGSGLKRIFKTKNSISGATEVFINELLLVENRLYFFENIESKNNVKCIFEYINLDGNGPEIIEQFEHSKIGENADLFDYLPSLFYDSGMLYYTNTDLVDSKFDLYQYDISANKKDCIIKNLSAAYSCKIAVHGDKVYYNGKINAKEGLYAHNISTGKDEYFITTGNDGIFDFAFFDRWLLMSSDEGLYCYDMQEGKLYLAGGLGSACNIVPTQKYVYFEEPDDYPFLWPVTFNDGKVMKGACINSIK